MPIARSNADVPRGQPEGNPPDPAPRFGQLLAEAWKALSDEHYHVKSRTDVERYVRLGWAGQCARAIGYKLLDVEPSNPTDLAGTWRMNLGTMVHELLQDAVRKAFPGAEVEKVVGAESDETFGFPVSGRSDLFLVTGGPGEIGQPDYPVTRTVVEVKTINGFGFKMAVGARGAPEGPRSGALFQAALNGRAHHADEVVVLVLSLECLSDRELDSLVKKQGGTADPWRKFLAEWSYSMADLDEMVDRELKRLGKIVTMVDAYAALEGGNRDAERLVAFGAVASLPPRSIPLEMPARARVTDPMTGRWEVQADGNVMDSGTVWMCQNYCEFRDRCAADGPS